jgi:peptide-methionine (S)-S-oxide reductase
MGDLRETATLAGGCFWCIEAVFEQVRGVERCVSGYSGGHLPDPTYEQVCGGHTGHAEVVQITFDPDIVSYRELLELFFTTHDPTTLNAQAPDVGPHYRSAVFHHSDEQRETAEAVITEVSERGDWPAPIVTEVVPFEEFFAAEDYHQGYFRSNPGADYCRFIIVPKVAKLRKEHFAALKA